MGKKVLIFSGEDVQTLGMGKIATMSQRGFDLLALDVPAFAVLAADSLPCKLIEDFIDPVEQNSLASTANDLGSRWFESERKNLTVDGVCFPEEDKHALFWFWKEVVLTVRLFEKIREQGYVEIACF